MTDQKQRSLKAYFEWKEKMAVELGDQRMVFEAPMGVSPHDVYVPTLELWSSRVPSWARDLRQEIIAVVRGVDGVGTVVEAADAWGVMGSA